MPFKHYLDCILHQLVKVPCDDYGQVGHITNPNLLEIQTAPTGGMRLSRVLSEDSEMPSPSPPTRASINYKYFLPRELYDLVKYGTNKMSVPRLIGICMECDSSIDDGQKYELYARNRGSTMSTGHRLICQNCISKFISCFSCGRLYHEGDLEEGSCPTCVHQAPKSLIRNYTYRVENRHKIIGISKDEIYYGVELEYESINYGVDTLKVHKLIKGFAELKKDSSIEQGFEVVSAPCSMETHEHLWDLFFAQLPPTVKPQRTCGMHVHASRIRMSALQIGKMLVFIHNPENRKFIKLIAERDSCYHNDFETHKSFTDACGGKPISSSDRHTALNLNSSQTIEFRIFNSTNRRENFLKNIEFCKALIKFSDWGVHSMSEAKSCLTFYHYVMKRRKEYHHLTEFLKNKVGPVLGFPVLRKQIPLQYRKK